jgi:hypothetical protein
MNSDMNDIAHGDIAVGEQNGSMHHIRTEQIEQAHPSRHAVRNLSSTAISQHHHATVDKRNA